MNYLTLEQVFELHGQLIEQSGGGDGLRDQGALESAVAQPQMTFGGEDLYPTLSTKVAAIGFSLIQNHPFVDGNKRIGHAAMAVMLMLNAHRIEASVDEQEQLILAIASSEMPREGLVEWLERHVVELFARDIAPYLRSTLIH